VFGTALTKVWNDATGSSVKHIVSSETSAAVDPVGTNLATLGSHTTILTDEVYTPINDSEPASYTWNVPLAEGSAETPDATATFVVVVVPVTVGAHAALHFGANLDATVGATSVCNQPSLPPIPNPTFGVNANLTPWANLDGVVEIACGVPGFEIGVKGDITLVRVSAPITGGLNVQSADGSPSGLAMVFNTTGNLKLGELSGSVSLFAQALFLSYEKQLFAWDGYTQNLSLWNTTASISLPAYSTVTLP
jgi:hypothetical protein